MPAPMNPDLKPVGDTRSHKHRMAKLASLRPRYLGMSFESFRGSDFFTAEAIRDTMEGTQFDGENHRRITPYVQEMAADDLVEEIDSRIYNQMFNIAEGLRSNLNPTTFGSVAKMDYDVVIVGSGPHGGAIAAYLREKRPDLTTLIIEKNEKVGGQWRSYGSRPVFQMNSRVRKADRRLPALPRTAGNINPLGMYAPIELSDIPTGIYAWNTEMGEVCAINAFLSADAILVETEVLAINSGYDYNLNNGAGGEYRRLSVRTPSGDRQITARSVIDATGLPSLSGVVRYDEGETPEGYFTAQSFYNHFGSEDEDNPLARFHDQKVVVIGKGDSALTVLEALLGNLPRATYGRSGVGRMRPRQIDWVGSFSSSYAEIEGCLRTRYKNGIVQSLKRGEKDESGIIRPDRGIVSRVRRENAPFFDVVMDDGSTLFPTIVIDCTTNNPGTRTTRGDWEPSFFVGPNNGMSFPDRTARRIRDLRIPENNVSLWATMQNSDLIGVELARTL